MKRSIVESKRINKRIQKLKDLEVEGKALRDRSYQAVMIEERRGKEKRFIAATPEVKEVIREKALNSGALNRFKKIQHRSQLYMVIETKQQLVRIANRVNMFEVVFENLKKFEIDLVFPCELIEGNRAWISQSEETKKYRYFTMQLGDKPYCLSIFDLIEIVDGVNGFQYATEELTRLLDLDDLKDEWIEMERSKYQSNLDCLDRSEITIQERYPNLHRYVEKKMELLRILNEYGRKHINRLFMYGGKHVFYVATTELAKQESLGMDQPAVNRAVNMLVLLGLIKKIQYDDLTSDLQAVAKGIRGNNKGFRYITFYQIPLLKHDTLMHAEKMAKRLEEVGIHGDRDVSKKNMGKFLGGLVFKSIYFRFPEGYAPNDNPGHPDDDELPFE